MKYFSQFNVHREKKWFISRRPSTKLIFILLGLLSTAWFIIRVIPKPSRASYPCMQAAAPFAAGFLTYIIALVGSVAAFRKMQSLRRNKQYLSSILALFVVFVGAFMMFVGDSSTGQASSSGLLISEPPNTPYGEARGIFPGRVVWVWDANATDETCTNTPGDYWFQDDNVDTDVIENMLSNSLQLLSGEDADSLAWDALFRHYNETHGNGNIPFQPGQKIAIKINLTTGGWGNISFDNYDKINLLEMMDGTPQLIVAMLKQLVDVYGIAQEDISIGDPIRMFYNQYWDPCHSLFPDIKYLDLYGFYGRTKATKSPEPVLFYSDGTVADSLPTAYTEADYMINMGCLKQHDLAGGTFCAKNHFGSCCRNMALHLHYALPSPTSNGFENLGYEKFRNLVDLMEHKDLGEKTMLFLVDGIWGGELPVTEPVKWQIEPFNDDWPNSIFVSQDHVAIESVGLDFVRAQFDEYADMLGADDYLHQAADSAFWAPGIIYDPEGDGEIIPSMGVHEHWNNDFDKEYTRNLGTGDGIELLKYLITGVGEEITSNNELTIFPNPFSDVLHLKFTLGETAEVIVNIYDVYGRHMMSSERSIQNAGAGEIEINTNNLSTGVYVYRMSIRNAGSIDYLQGKIIKE